jgi:DedD protein
MEEGAKRRLVGTAVVVLLLVIFVPMLLNEEPSEPLPKEDTQIPPRPAIEPSTRAEMPPSQGGLEAAPTPRELPIPPVSQPTASRAQSPPTGPGTKTRSTETAPASATTRRPEPATRAPERAAAPTPQARTERRPPPAPPGVSSWVIQVASLTEPQRAKNLERDLRAKGFPAFIQDAQVDHRTFHRVRVGPEADRKRIERMAASIKAKTGLSVQIQRYP